MPHRLPRGRLLATLSLAVAIAAAAGLHRARARDRAGTVEREDGAQRLTVREGTNIAPAVSPDRRTVIMDLQGALWSLPLTGGTARRLTPALLEPARPDWSPRGDLVAFQAYAGGTFHVWTMQPDGSDVRQRTFGHGDDREPRFSPDGTRLAFSSDRAFAGSYDIWVLDLATGTLTPWTSSALDEFEPAWSPDGGEIAFVSGNGATGTKVEAVTAAGARRTVVTAPAGSRLNSPCWAPGGTHLAYVQFANNRSQLMVDGTRVGASDDVFPFFPQWLSNDELLYAADGHLRTSTLAGATQEIPFSATFELRRPDYPHKRHDFDRHDRRPAKGIVGPTLSPDGRQVAFQALNQIWVMEIGKKPHPVTADAYLKLDPAWSPDGTQLAYSSDKAGTEDLYLLDLRTGAERRVTSLPGAEVSAAFSPDGTQLAFQDQTGATFTLELASGNVRKVIGSLFAPGKPSWSADGKTIAVAALKPYTKRFREGTSQILTVDLGTGALTYTEPAPFLSLSTRGEDGPVYSPDGSAIAFVMESLLYVKPVDAHGLPTGTARPINDETTDAPTWSGDGQQLLYLSNGKLRLVRRDGSGARTIPVDLSWRDDQPEGRTVVHAGRLWDGRGPRVSTDMDVVIEGHRIAAVVPHAAAHHAGARVVDASGLTVLPGLWESHTHQWISGKFFGDRLGRLWLAYGVTSLRSVGDPVYRAAETAESFASGARVGPRYFQTGEAIDGERVYYNFMRPVTGGDAQLARELSRAQAVDYDMVKTYVRLPHADQAKVVRFAHDEMGVWTASHYMLPGMAFGMDGQTHVSATTRLGFAYTRSSAGVSYADMTGLFARSGMFDISTTFNSSLYAEDPAMVEDPRLLALNPPWEQAGLVAKRDAAVVPGSQAVSLDSLAKEEATVAAILDGGGIVLAGTDSPLDNPATALHLNLRAQQKFGRAPWQALQTATLLPARAFGLERDLGTIEPGKLADLVMVGGDPLSDVKAVADVRGVVRNGRHFTPAELMAPFTPDGLAAAATHEHHLLPALEHRGDDRWWHDPKEFERDECAGD